MDKKYVIYQNDLKHRNMTKLDINKIDWNQNDIRHLYNINHDTLEYRFKESEKDNYQHIDLTNLNLINLPKQLDSNIFYNNLLHLFISNNNIKGKLNLSNFKKLESIDIDNNDIDEIILPESLKELSISNNKLKYIKCNKNLIRIKCSNNLLEKIDLNNNLEICVFDNNKLTILDMRKLNLCEKIIIYNNPLQNLLTPSSLKYLDLSETLISELYDCDNLLHLVANKCINLKNLPKYKNIEFIEIIETPIEKLYFYEKYKLILIQLNITKNISKKYKENNALIQIRNNILLTISKGIEFM